MFECSRTRCHLGTLFFLRVEMYVSRWGLVIPRAVWAAVLGEWKGTRPKEKWIMVASLLCMAGAIVTIGFSAQ